MSDYINIEFPFKDDVNGKYLNLNSDSNNAIKSELLLLLLTTKGQRLYLPDFGTNLKKFIFNQLDGVSLNEIKIEINTAISKYIPKLKVTSLVVIETPLEEHTAVVNINYTITDDVFETKDNLIIKF